MLHPGSNPCATVAIALLGHKTFPPRTSTASLLAALSLHALATGYNAHISLSYGIGEEKTAHRPFFCVSLCSCALARQGLTRCLVAPSRARGTCCALPAAGCLRRNAIYRFCYARTRSTVPVTCSTERHTTPSRPLGFLMHCMRQSSWQRRRRQRHARCIRTPSCRSQTHAKSFRRTSADESLSQHSRFKVMEDDAFQKDSMISWACFRLDRWVEGLQLLTLYGVDGKPTGGRLLVSSKMIYKA